MSTTPTSSVPATTRAALYSALARLLDQPSSWDDDLRTTLEDLAANGDSPFASEVGAVHAALGACWDDRLKAEIAYTKLFLGPLEILAPPYESLFLDPERGLMGPVSLAVAAAYEQADLGPGDGPRDAPEWEQQARDFWNEHLGRWLGTFAVRMLSADLHPVYDAIAKLLLLVERCENERHSHP